MARLRWLPEARQDIERLYEFLRETSPEAGLRAEQLSLEQFAEMHRRLGAPAVS